MNYIELINNFWALDRENPFTLSETRLFFVLLNTCNSLGWKNPFNQSNMRLASECGVTEPTFTRARNVLKQKGLIEFSSSVGRRKNTIYTIKYPNYLGISNGNSEGNCEGNNRGNSEGNCDEFALYYNKHKLNKTKLNIFSYENDDGKIEKIDYDKFLDFFNSETNGVFGKPKKPISETRKKHIRARLSEHKVAGFVNMLKKAVTSNFLKGENKNGWSATLDWMINQSNFQKIIEGNYDNKSGGNSKNVNDIWENQ